MSVQYVTRNTSEAAYFCTLEDLDLVGDFMQGRTVYFKFEAEDKSEDDLAQIQQDWRNDRVLVNPKVYYAKLQELKQIINSSRFGK